MYPQAPQQGYAPQAPPQPADREIQGILQSVEQRNGGWMRFHILAPGNQYPTKVDTKQPELIQQAMSLMGQPVSAQIREQQSTNINPNNNKPYINRYLNAIAPLGFAPGVMPAPGAVGPQGQQFQPQPPMPPQQPQQWPTPTQSVPVPPPSLSGFDKDIAIFRQVGAKLAVEMFDHLPAEQRNVKGMVEAAETWVAYFVHGPLRFGVTPFNTPKQEAPQAPPILGPPPIPEGAQGGYMMAPQQPAPQTDIFGAPQQPDGTPIYNDPGREDGDPGPQYS